VERARLLIEQAEALGEPPEDPLLLFSVLFGVWAANVLAFDANVSLDLAAHFLTLAEKRGATVPLMVGHRNMGASLFYAGDVAQSRVHYDRAIALYDPAEHRSLATRFSADVKERFCPIGRGRYGYWAIPRPHSETPMTLSRMRERRVKPPRYCSPFASQA
jgi:hypothetical protein